MRIAVHTQIILGMVAGLVWGLLSHFIGLPASVTVDWIKPLGTLFVHLLKMAAIPLVLASLITGVAQLDDVKKLSRIGGKTIFIYVLTTFFAICIGLVLVNVIQPGKIISEDTRAHLVGMAATNTTALKSETSTQAGPLDMLVNTVPTNIVAAMGDNLQMIQVVFVAIFFGIAAIKVPKQSAEPFLKFFESLNEILLQAIEMIMKLAPFGVFALLAAVVVEIPKPDALFALLTYSLTVLLGLVLVVGVFYPLLLALFSGVKIKEFYKAVRPAQLLAFSTSSSSATLPVTMRCCEEGLKLPEKVTSFVLPLGATINMDGTSLYQAVAAVFIAQVAGIPLDVYDQLVIAFAALMASIGSAGVPGAGMVMLTVILQSVGIPAEYLVLIMAPDRLLDMFRTVINVSGDMVVACIITKQEEKASL